uniref:TLDc domain-containing protein n=2 Tax=Rhizophagus irregularis TaxID=588596 RepID=U9ULV3_RHIID
MKNLYEFKLILRGTRDGFSASKFHEICDYQSHTISIIKVKDSNEILGGYNPIIWKSDNTNGTTKDSFIFSFKNKEKIEENILSRVKDENFAICNNPNFGPVFGGHELILCTDNHNGMMQFPAYYELIREIGNFFVEEFEVFQIMKD